MGTTARTPTEQVVYDVPHACPYLPGREARLPMRLPSRRLSPDELDARLAEGDRRHGIFLYRPTCSGCQACEAIRIRVADFRPRASHRRALRRGDQALTLELGPPRADAERLALYEKHKHLRGLSGEDREPLGLDGYRGFLVERCVDSLELRYRFEGRLVGVAVTDVGATSLSAVYCLWDPELSHLSLGTYSILKQVELCRARGLLHLYLGLYVGGNAHMAYKSRYLPHERLIGGAWRRFERGA